MKSKLFLIFSFFVLLLMTACQKEASFEEKREEILSELNFAIEEAEKEGKYNCCIKPSCTMCYLGNWIWEDGSCYCDDMIAKGEDDKVCPECKKGLEEGSCKSINEEICDFEIAE
jgi:hypothetical protein